MAGHKKKNNQEKPLGHNGLKLNKKMKSGFNKNIPCLWIRLFEAQLLNWETMRPARAGF